MTRAMKARFMQLPRPMAWQRRFPRPLSTMRGLSRMSITRRFIRWQKAQPKLPGLCTLQ